MFMTNHVKSFFVRHSLVLVLLPSFLLSCSSFKIQDIFYSSLSLKDQKKIYKEALFDLENEHYDKARRKMEFLKKKPHFKLDFHLRYHLGLVYEGLGDCERAETQYRSLIRSSFKQFEALKAKSLLRLGYVYECLKLNVKAIGSFMDAQKREAYFSPLVIRAEVPSRLALAYVRLHQWEVAKSFFELSRKGFQDFYEKRFLRGKEGWTEKERKHFAKTLYFMGHLDKGFLEILEEDLYFKALSYLQEYLMEAIKTRNLRWAKKAKEDIEKAYKKTWEFLRKDEIRKRTKMQKRDFLPEEKWSLKLLANQNQSKAINKKQEEQRAKIASLTLMNIYSLKKNTILIKREGKKEERKWVSLKKELIKFLENQEAKWAFLVYQKPIRTSLTSEGKKRLQ